MLCKLSNAHITVELGNTRDGSPEAWWVGGGADLTPIYLDRDDALHFHRVWKSTCDTVDTSYYQRFKKWCDQYFYLAHRQEARGIGGIFFDDLDEYDRDTMLTFLDRCGHQFNTSYFPLVSNHVQTPFTEEEKRWQQIRRGRYVEFNLIWDRGTKFGLHTPRYVWKGIVSNAD